MPYKRRYKRKRKAKTLNARIRAVVQRQTETKLVQQDIASGSITTIWAFHELPEISEGVSANQRVGQKVLGKYLNMRFMLASNSSAGGVQQFVRVLLVSSTHTLDASDMPADYMQCTFPQQDVRVHYDRMHSIQYPLVNMSPSAKENKFFTINKIKPGIQRWESNVNNHFVGRRYTLCFVSSHGTNSPTLSGFVKYAFTDI